MFALFKASVAASVLVLAGCQSILDVVPEPAPTCPTIEPQECPVCEVQQCPEPVVIERIVVQPAPAPEPVPERPDTGGELDLPIIGRVEFVQVEPPGLRLEGLIDTAAAVSTIRASDISLLEKDGKRYVSYTLLDPDTGEAHTLESLLRRRSMVQHADGTSTRNYVVLMWLALGDIRARVEVMLSEQAGMAYPLRVGRNLLTDFAIVDVSRQHTLDK